MAVRESTRREPNLTPPQERGVPPDEARHAVLRILLDAHENTQLRDADLP